MAAGQEIFLGTQEATKDQLNDILAACPNYGRFGSGRDGGEAGESSAIFWKSSRLRIDNANSGDIWLSNTPSVPSRFGGSYNRVATYVRLVDKQSNAAFSVYNIHNYMPAESDYRLQAVKLLAKTMANRANPKEPVFLTGDFNSPEADAVTQWMKSGTDNPIRFRDSYRDFDPSGSVTTGFGTKFDYIYYPDESKYRTVRSYVANTPVASDHSPIVADVIATETSSIIAKQAREVPTPMVRIEASMLTIELAPSSRIDRIEVVDLKGRVETSSSGRQPRHRLDVSSLPGGTHILRLLSEGGYSAQPIVLP